MRSNWLGLLGNVLSLVAVIWMAMMLTDARSQRDAARANAERAVSALRQLDRILAAEHDLNAALARKQLAYIDTITALRREHSARAYPKRRAQLDSLTSPLTATPDDVRAWLKQ